MTVKDLLRIVIVAIVVAVVVVFVVKLVDLGIQTNTGMVAAIAAGVTAGPMALVALRKKKVK
ncbi:MAG: hypothetical protein ACK5WB_09350 [Phycisphaerales bacterium]|jgi:hypothetical protein|nr:hypothetical protein [Phycisphaeraceae bacterium]